jgi:hypothetical protein
MSAPDNFKFADIPAPATPDEARFVELVRLVVREELRKRDEAIFVAASGALTYFQIARGIP